MKEILEEFVWVLIIGFVFLNFASVNVNAGEEPKLLLLSHFNEKLDADYSAIGKTKAEVYDAKITEGKKGYPFKSSKPSSEAVDIGYSTGEMGTCVMYEAKGNIDTQKGTIEFWLKTKWDWTLDDIPQDIMPQFVDVPFDNGHHLYIYCSVHRPGKQIALGFGIDVPVPPEESGSRVVSYNVGPKDGNNPGAGWLGDEWHHVLASWDTSHSVLFIDGQKVSEKIWDKKSEIGNPKDKIYIGRSVGGGRSACALIDELRILNSPVSDIEIPGDEYSF